MATYRDLTLGDVGGSKAAVDIYSLRLRPVAPRLVSEYAEAFAGEVFAEAAPVLAHETEKGTYLVDGFHRMTAFRKWPRLSREAPRAIKCEVYQGTYTEAVVASATANLGHGDRPNPKARWATILRLRWQDPDHWSYQRIADVVGMSRSGVQNVVELDRDVPREPKREGRDGLVYGDQRRLSEILQDTSSDEYKRVLEIKRWQQAEVARNRATEPSAADVGEAINGLHELAMAAARLRQVHPASAAQVLMRQDADRWGTTEPRPTDAQYASDLRDSAEWLRLLAQELDALDAAMTAGIADLKPIPER